MNVQEIAQTIVNELQDNLKKAEDQKVLIEGAIQGVNLLYTRLMEASKPVEDSKPKSDKPKSKKKKK